jgi:hypothetical protein
MSPVGTVRAGRGADPGQQWLNPVNRDRLSARQDNAGEPAPDKIAVSK